MSPSAIDSDSRVHCQRELRRHDYDRYLASLMLKGDVRRAAIALFAFNLEIARTPEIVSETLLGEMRLQFWRDSIADLYRGDRAREHPVAQELGWLIAKYDPARDQIERLLAARQRDLDGSPPRSIADLEGYVGDTSSALLEPLVRLADPNGPPATDAVRHVGLAFGLSGLLRAVPYHARQRRLYLPADLLAAAGVNEEQVFAGTFTPALGKVVEMMAMSALEHLAQARALWRQVPRRQRDVLLVGSFATLDLRRLQRLGYNPFHPGIGVSPLRRLLRIVGARMTGLR